MGVLSNFAIIVLLICIGGNGIEARGVVGGFEDVPDLPIFNQVTEVTDLSLPSIKRQLEMSDIEVLNFENAERQVNAGNKWKITIDTNGTYGPSSRTNTITFTVEQFLPENCPNGEKVCIGEVLIDTPPNEAEQRDQVGEFERVPNFERFQVLYQVTRLVLLDLEEKFEVEDIKLVTFLKASSQVVQGTNWKIEVKVETQSIYLVLGSAIVTDLRVSFEVFQPLPKKCQPEGEVCVKDPTKVVISLEPNLESPGLEAIEQPSNNLRGQLKPI